MQADLAGHDDLMRAVFSAHDGVVFSNAGDSFGVAFASPSAAADAAIEVQCLIADRTWTVDGGIAVRIGIHTGAAHERNDNFYGPTLNETARIMSVGHGGQVIVAAAVSALLDVPTEPLGEHRLRDLAGRWPLFQVDVPGSDNRHPSLNSLGDHRSTLPVQGTGLIGRDEVIDDVRDALRTHRLVTLLGPGGAGKTRVAIEAAGRSIAAFPGGAYFVDLTTLTDSNAVRPAFVDGLARAVPPDRTPSQHVLAALGGPPAIVVVDNCEHVLDAIAVFVEELLAAAPGVRVLATSRVPLELTEEHTLALPPLGAETGESPAVQLFVEQALTADPAFEFDVAALETVARITRRLDGMPLAIELAAARIRTLTPAIDALAAMPADDPSRRLFEAYRLLALTPVDPDSVIAESDELLPEVLEQVTRSHDYSLAFIFLARSIGLLAVQRVEERFGGSHPRCESAEWYPPMPEPTARSVGQ